MQNLYSKSYKTQLKEMKDLNKWKDGLYSQIGGLNTLQMIVLPK